MTTEDIIVEEAQRLYLEHAYSKCSGCQATPATFRAAAVRIKQLEDAVRDRDRTIVELHEQVTFWQHEHDGAARELAYWKALSPKSKDSDRAAEDWWEKMYRQEA